MANYSKNVFLIGPGLIGREIIDLLLAEDYNVTTLVRREAAAIELQKANVKTVLGSIDDKALLRKVTRDNDIIIHCASADHLPSIEAVIDGVTDRANDGKQTVYIHTSGCSFLSDDSAGAYKSDKIFSDKHPEDLDALPASAPHREMDLAIIRARHQLGTKAKLFIVLPPIIYGTNMKYKRLSIQMPIMARFAIKHGYAAHVGKGLSTWGLVHVSDLAKGYMTILHWLEQSDPDTALEHPYFFCENGEEISWKGAAELIGQSLYNAGKISTPEPRETPKHLYNDLFGEFTDMAIGGNARNRAERLRELGWHPEHTDLAVSWEKEELPLILEDNTPFHGYAGVVASRSG